MFIFDSERRARPWHIHEASDPYVAFALCGKVFDLVPTGVTFGAHPEGGDASICGICINKRDQQAEVVAGYTSRGARLLQQQARNSGNPPIVEIRDSVEYREALTFDEVFS